MLAWPRNIARLARRAFEALVAQRIGLSAVLERALACRHAPAAGLPRAHPSGLRLALPENLAKFAEDAHLRAWRQYIRGPVVELIISVFLLE